MLTFIRQQLNKDLERNKYSLIAALPLLTVGEPLEGVAGPHYHCYTLRHVGISLVPWKGLFISQLGLEVWLCAFITTESKNSCGNLPGSWQEQEATPTPNTRTQELPVPPTQGKPSVGDKQVLLTHKTNK